MPLAIVIPAYNTQASLDRVLGEIPDYLRSGVIVIDDGSDTPIQATDVRLIRHPENLGYGAAQKTGYDAAIEMGAERVVLLHGDGQYATEDVLGLNDALAACDAAIGSRFLNMGAAHMPIWRRWGNRVLTFMANARYGSDLSELHSGARGFRVSTLKKVDYHKFSDDYIFDHQMWAVLLSQGVSIGERKVRCTYDDSVQSIAVAPSIKYAMGVMRTIVRPPPSN